MDVERPIWPYYIGAWSAGLFGVATAYLAYMITGKPTASGMMLAGYAYAIGATGLGVGWLGMVKQHNATFAPVAGSFAIPIAIAILKVSKPDDVMFAGGMIVLVAMAFFAIAHVFVQHLPLTRFVAVPGALVLLYEVIANTAHWKIDRDTDKLLMIVSLGSLTLIGFSLAFTLPGLRKRNVENEL
jgi:hypothetical protein